MAHTYDKLPIAVPTVFRSLVTAVSNNLSGELGTDVQFIHGTWLHIRERLTAMDSSKYVKNEKYPLVALIHDFQEKVTAGAKYMDIDVTLLICTTTTGDMYSEDRYTNNYLPILYPIYAELMEQIKRSKSFVGYMKSAPEHTKVDDLHMGTDSEDGNGGYKLPDKLDGIWIKNLSLTINTETCTGMTTVMLPSVAFSYYNIITDVELSIDGQDLVLSAEAVNYSDGVLTPVPIYEVYWGDTSDESLTLSTDTPHDVSGLADGNYTGYVQCNDGITTATLSFTYTVTSGYITDYTTSNEFNKGTLSQSIGAPFTVVTRYRHYSDKLTAFALIETTTLTSIYSDTFTAPLADSTELTKTNLVGISATMRSVKQELTVNGLALNSNFYYKLNTL